VIGDNVVLQSGSVLHGCTIEEGSFVGEGAQVMDGAKVSAGSKVAAGAVLSPGKVVPPGQLWAGVPAAFERALTAAEAEGFSRAAGENSALGRAHEGEAAKSWQAIELDEYEHDQTHGRNEYYYPRLSKEQLSERLGEVEGHMVPGRILNSPSNYFILFYLSSIDLLSSLQIQSLLEIIRSLGHFDCFNSIWFQSIILIIINIDDDETMLINMQRHLNHFMFS
jgi:hypothetical protein